VGRGDDGAGPAHDVVAGEEGLFFAESEADVVGDVTGGVEALESPVG